MTYASETGGMPTLEAAYDAKKLTELYPAEVLDLFRESGNEGGPRPTTEYWATIVNAVLSQWHPQDGVTEETRVRVGVVPRACPQRRLARLGRWTT